MLQKLSASVTFWNHVQQTVQHIFRKFNKVENLPVTWQYRIWCQPQNPVRIPSAIRLPRVCVTASSGTASPLFKATLEINSTILDDSPTRWIVFFVEIVKSEVSDGDRPMLTFKFWMMFLVLNNWVILLTLLCYAGPSFRKT